MCPRPHELTQSALSASQPKQEAPQVLQENKQNINVIEIGISDLRSEEEEAEPLATSVIKSVRFIYGSFRAAARVNVMGRHSNATC